MDKSREKILKISFVTNKDGLDDFNYCMQHIISDLTYQLTRIENSRKIHHSEKIGLQRFLENEIKLCNNILSRLVIEEMEK